MQIDDSSIINIAVIGGGTHAKELIEKTTVEYRESEVNARMKALADPDPLSPGRLSAEKLGLITVDDYHELYDQKYNIRLFIILTPDRKILNDILETKPPHILIESFHVFELFWKIVTIEEKKLRQRNEEVEAILNGIQDFISVIRPDMTIIEANDALVKHRGYRREEIIGKKCYEVFQNLDHPCDSTENSCPLNNALKNETFVRQVMTRILPNKDRRYYEINISPIWEKDGRISEFIDISRDITSRLKEEEEITKRLEQMVEERTRQLKETHDKLLHQDKMFSLGKLAASVVHEINNPIAGILNLTMLIKRIVEEGPIDEKDMDKFRQYLDLMETETRRTSRIVSNLLTFSRQSRIELGRIQINQIIESTLLLNSNLLKINGIKIHRKLDSNLPDFVGSSDQIQQVLMNFLSNAAEAMESTDERILYIETRHLIGDDSILIRFKDTGVGIPVENLPRLFEPFFTTKKGKGAGLGLSVAYGIVQEHGGTIDVRSEWGKGATFDIVLPLRKIPENTDQKGGPHEQQ
ncbi:MAG: PAS domain-containing protein [Deltaproteobacteria bacterium]|nr:PAS domain-containing protein [Deltaproteobacteria bacterium]